MIQTSHQHQKWSIQMIQQIQPNQVSQLFLMSQATNHTCQIQKIQANQVNQ